jgi:hypothetical protein
MKHIKLFEEFKAKEMPNKDSDTLQPNPGEDSRMLNIRAFRGSVKDLVDFVADKVKESQK